MFSISNPQWGTLSGGNNAQVILPIALSAKLYSVLITDTCSGGYPLAYGAYNLGINSFYAYSYRTNGNVETVIFGRWLAIGK